MLGSSQADQQTFQIAWNARNQRDSLAADWNIGAKLQLVMLTNLLSVILYFIYVMIVTVGLLTSDNWG